MKDTQLLRYSRQLMLPELGMKGQQTLLRSQVLVVGLGGLGCPAAMYLAAAGVGRLCLADDERVELMNLQRQIAHATADIDASKTTSASATLRALNPEIHIDTVTERLDEQSAAEHVADADLVLDASDNFETRFALNRVAQRLRTPLVFGAAIRMEGQVAVFDHRQGTGPCYRCLYDEAAVQSARHSCADSGVLSPIVGVIGAMQAVEALKILAGIGRSLHGRLLLFDGLQGEWRALKLPPDPRCPVCGAGERTPGR